MRFGKRHFASLLLIVFLVLNSSARLGADDDEMVKGVVVWEAGKLPSATYWDKTDFWCAIAVSPSTGKFAASCEWSNQDNAVRQAREKCNEKDAKTVILCCNGWCSIAMGKRKAGEEADWGIGWGPHREDAEKYALEAAHDDKIADAKVVYSISAREPRQQGAIAFAASTGDWGYASGGPHSAPYNAIKNCGAKDAKVVMQESDCWMALAMGDDKTCYGAGHAGNRDDAEAFALKECNKVTKNAKIVASFCVNGVVPEDKK